MYTYHYAVAIALSSAREYSTCGIIIYFLYIFFFSTAVTFNAITMLMLTLFHDVTYIVLFFFCTQTLSITPPTIEEMPCVLVLPNPFAPCIQLFAFITYIILSRLSPDRRGFAIIIIIISRPIYKISSISLYFHKRLRRFKL